MNDFQQALTDAKIRIYHGEARGIVLDDWPCLQYQVEVKVDLRTVMETEYHIGLGLAPSLPNPWRNIATLPSPINETLGWLSCNPGKNLRDKAQHARAIAAWTNHRKHRLDRDDVFPCILSDSEAIDYPDFESWALNVGFDTDSRKAEATYRECLETALKLRAALGEETLSHLQELALDH